MPMRMLLGCRFVAVGGSMVAAAGCVSAGRASVRNVPQMTGRCVHVNDEKIDATGVCGYYYTHASATLPTTYDSSAMFGGRDETKPPTPIQARHTHLGPYSTAAAGSRGRRPPSFCGGSVRSGPGRPDRCLALLAYSSRSSVPLADAEAFGVD